MRRSLIPTLALVGALGTIAVADPVERVSSLGDQRAVGINRGDRSAHEPFAQGPKPEPIGACAVRIG